MSDYMDIHEKKVFTEIWAWANSNYPELLPDSDDCDLKRKAEIHFLRMRAQQDQHFLKEIPLMLQIQYNLECAGEPQVDRKIQQLLSCSSER